MSESTAIAARDGLSVVNRIAEFNQIADVFSKSGLFPDIKSQGQAFVKILAGAEIGLPPFTSMNAFYIYGGRVTMYANTIAARIKTSGRYNYRVNEKSAAKCVIDFYELGKLVLTETWTAERASKAGTQNMVKYPDAMLFARCITSGARAVCPEVIGAFYAPEELGATVNADGEIIDAPATTTSDAQHAANQEKLGRNGQDADFSKANTGPKSESTQSPQNGPPTTDTKNGDAPVGNGRARVITHRDECIELVSKLTAASLDKQAAKLDVAIKNANIAIERGNNETTLHSHADRLKTLRDEAKALLAEPAPAQ